VGSRRRDERGIAVSSPLVLLSAAAVVLAGAGFVATGGPRHDEAAPVSSRVSAATSAAPRSAPATTPRRTPGKPHHARVVRRGDTYVEVFNNSGIKGLAASTAARAQGAGWQVVGSDNWYGTIAASTVYYPAPLHAQARLLAEDLGITRIRPVIAPMRGDRLTVILTSDYS